MAEEARQPTLAHDVLALVLKIALIVAAAFALFGFVFGVYRVGDVGMSPGVKDGDLVMYYRLDRSFAAGEVVGGVMGDDSPSGATNGWAVTSGKLAAESLAAAMSMDAAA